MRKPLGHRLLLWLLPILLIVGLLSVFFRRNSLSRGIPIGNAMTVEFLGVTAGSNNLRHGSFLERLLGDEIPARGLRVGPLILRRPMTLRNAGDAAASAWLVVRGAGPAPRGFSYYWEGSDAVISNRSGRQFSIPTAQPFHIDAKQVVLRVPLVAFPRDGKTVFLRLSPPAEPGAVRQCLEFEFENPLQTSAPKWNASPAPVTNKVGDLQFILTSAAPNKIMFALPSADWSISDCRMFDNEGNSFGWSRTEGPRDLQTKVWFDHWLEVNRSWRVRATFIRGVLAGRPIAQIPTSECRVARLTRSAPEISLTNTTGEVFSCRVVRDELHFRNETGNVTPYWIILSATNQDNERIDVSSVGWTGTGGASAPQEQVWSLPKPCSALDLQLACPLAISREFLVNPAE